MLLRLICLVLLTQIIDGCDPPYEIVEGGCYYYNRDLYVGSYNAASQFCQDHNGHMAVVKSGEENRAIIDNLLTPNVDFRNVLLGAKTKEHDLFEWVDGTLVRDSFTSWGEEEPNDSGDCMGYSTNHEMFWNDIPCDDYTDRGWFVGILCEQSPGQNLTTTQGPTTTPTTTPTKIPTTPTPTTTPTTMPFECPDGFDDLGTGCYHIADELITWPEGREYCESIGSHLACITSAEEQGILETYIYESNATDDILIGGFDLYGNNTFYWLDGTPLDDGYTNWYAGEPDSYDGLYMARYIVLHWADTSLSSADNILCEINI